MNSQPPKNFSVDEQFKSWKDMDTNQLLRIFPEEIWKVILENVRDFKSLENLSNASPFFRERLLSKRSIFLFPGFFECLIKRHEQDDQTFATDTTNLEEDNTEDEESEEGRVWKFPWGLRLVCLEWNQSIQAYFQKPNIKPFVQKRRYVSISIGISAFTEYSTQMLAKFGPILKCVHLNLMYPERENLVGYYLLLQKVLNYLPNLQELEIGWPTGRYDDIQNHELAEMIDMNPCYVLKNLESLSVVEQLPPQIFRELVRRNNSFKGLKLFLNEVQPLTFDFSMPLPNLNYLDVTIQLDQDFQQLKMYAKDWKLITFCGQFRYFTDKNAWMQVFQMIEDNWGNTLEELCLYLPKDSAFRPTATVCEMVLNITTDERLKNMKVLKSVDIVTDCAISLDFLLPCQETLEEMRIVQFGNSARRNQQNAYYNDAKDRQLVEYLGKETEMEESNIWNLFPKLKRYQSMSNEVKRPSKYGIV